METGHELAYDPKSWAAGVWTAKSDNRPATVVAGFLIDSTILSL
ncbi:hypothetical protein [Metaplanococcus flavidus]|uniref:Uncharacterized protein n=1 Tax=Metaplanococcus flavidus TaxID=569883 RepID=A0ABW3LBP4_9BACL